MSELKAHYFLTPTEIAVDNWAQIAKTTALQYYLKDDADKVIEDLEESHKKEVEQLLMEIVELKGKYKELAKLHDKAIQACCDADKVIADKDKEIAELKEERRWRKFPDEKPEWGKEVLVLDIESEPHIVRFSHDMKWISWGKMNTCESKYVEYWMPLPSAPKEEK